MKTVIVSGAAGFLGSHIAEHFLKKDYAVIGLDNFTSSTGQNIELLQAQYPQFQFFKHDASESWSPLKSAAQGRNVEYVFHFASPAAPKYYLQQPLETIRVNTVGLMEALSFAETFGARVIFASSSEIYGESQVHPQPESYWGHSNSFGPRSCYHQAKRLGESIIFEYNKRSNVKHGLVRIFNTYGPRMSLSDGRVVVNFLQQALTGEPLTIYGQGIQTRSFCYVDDLIEGLVRYAEAQVSVPMNLGNPSEISMIKLIDHIQEIFPERKLHCTFEELPSEDPKTRCPDITKAQQMLGWTPKINLPTGLRLMKTWMAAQPRKGGT